MSSQQVGTNWFSTFTIDKGSNDGIREDMNVLAGSGLAGIVTEGGPQLRPGSGL